MVALPAPPRTAQGALAVDRYQVVADMCEGLLSACCVCGQSGGWWWRQECTYFPLHSRCVPKLIEFWTSMIAEGAQETMRSAPLVGAYARRAAARSATVTRPASVDGGSPYFRPGMPAGAPWTVCVLTVVGVSIVPCGLNAEYARALAGRQRAAQDAGVPGSHGAQIVGGCVVGPDGAVSCQWGQVPTPGAPAPWESLSRSSLWGHCRGCGDRMWPGRWRGDVSGQCTRCLRATSQRPSWPEDGACLARDPGLPVLKRKRERLDALD